MSGKPKVIFDPSCFDDGLTQEDIDDITSSITRMVEDGTLLENSEPVDMDKLLEEDPEMHDFLMNDDKPTVQ